MKRTLSFLAVLLFSANVQAASLTVQPMGFGGLNPVGAAASTSDSFANDGRTFLIFTNSNASARTLTIAANSTTRPGYGPIATPSTVVTLPGSGTNGGLAVIGPFPAERFNSLTSATVSYTIDAVTGLNVSAVSMTRYQ